MSSNQSGEGEIRKNLIEADLVDCMVALPGQLFYSTQKSPPASGSLPAIVTAVRSETVAVKCCSSTLASSAAWSTAPTAS